MNSRGKYKTQHYDRLLRLLQERPAEHLTAAEVYACMHEEGSGIGRTTVYRLLERMVDEGLVNKLVAGQNDSARYELIDPVHRARREYGYHLKCERCGRLVHLRCGEVASLGTHLLAEHGFEVDPLRTVFYGRCADCR